MKVFHKIECPKCGNELTFRGNEKSVKKPERWYLRLTGYVIFVITVLLILFTLIAGLRGLMPDIDTGMVKGFGECFLEQSRWIIGK